MKDNLTYNSSIDNLFEDEEIVDIKDIYIQMFQKIKEFILTNKEKIK